MKFARRPYHNTHLTLSSLLHYFGKLKTIFFCRYSAELQENANMHFKCTDFNSSMRVAVYAECIYVLTKYLIYLAYKG